MTLYHLYEGVTPQVIQDDSAQLSLGTEFLITGPAWVTQFRVLIGEGDTTTLPRQMAVTKITEEGDFSSISVPGQEVTQTNTPGWSITDITPVFLQPGRYKVTAFHPQGQYTAVGGWFESGPNSETIVRGPVTIPKTSEATKGNATYYYGPELTLPDSSFSGGGYFADVTISDTDPSGTPKGRINVLQNGAWESVTGETSVLIGETWVPAQMYYLDQGAWAEVVL